MPSPAIKYPPGVSVRRDGAITYKRPAALNKPAHDFGVVGRVEPIRNHLPSNTVIVGDADGWFARYADGGRVRDDEMGGPLKPFKGQREAVRAVLQAQGFWPTEAKP